ncbi:MAG: hypothetical protein QXO40_02535 [Candidatus Aenigmatarchaeota archaeon]
MEIPFQIIFATIVSVILLFTFVYVFSTYREEESRNKVFKSFYNLKNKIENMCWSFPFSQENEKIILNENVQALFVYPISITKLDNLNDIKDKIIEGEFLCIAYKDERIKCEKLSCNTTMKTYHFERKKEFLDFIIKSFYGIKEFEIVVTLYKNFTKVDIF